MCAARSPPPDLLYKLPDTAQCYTLAEMKTPSICGPPLKDPLFFSEIFSVCAVRSLCHAAEDASSVHWGIEIMNLQETSSESKKKKE